MHEVVFSNSTAYPNPLPPGRGGILGRKGEVRAGRVCRAGVAGEARGWRPEPKASQTGWHPSRRLRMARVESEGLNKLGEKRVVLYAPGVDDHETR